MPHRIARMHARAHTDTGLCSEHFEAFAPALQAMTGMKSLNFRSGLPLKRRLFVTCSGVCVSQCGCMCSCVSGPNLNYVLDPNPKFLLKHWL